MAIVAQGLGQPEDGALVAGGLGLTEQVAGAITAHLTGGGTLTATLTATGTTGGHPAGGATRTFYIPAPPPRIVAPIAAHLSGSGDLYAWVTAEDYETDDELVLLLV